MKESAPPRMVPAVCLLPPAFCFRITPSLTVGLLTRFNIPPTAHSSQPTAHSGPVPLNCIDVVFSFTT